MRLMHPVILPTNPIYAKGWSPTFLSNVMVSYSKEYKSLNVMCGVVCAGRT